MVTDKLIRLIKEEDSIIGLLRIADIPEVDSYPIVINYGHLFYCVHCSSFKDTDIVTINYSSASEMKERFIDDIKNIRELKIIDGSLNVRLVEDYELYDQHAGYEAKKAVVVDFNIHDAYETVLSQFFEEFYITLYDFYYSSIIQKKSEVTVLSKLLGIIDKYDTNDKYQKSGFFQLGWLENTDDFVKLKEYLKGNIVETLHGKMTFKDFLILAEKTMPDYFYKMDLAEAFYPSEEEEENGKYFYNYNFGLKIASAEVKFSNEYDIYQLLDYRKFFNKYHYFYRYDIIRTNIKTGEEQIFLANSKVIGWGVLELGIDDKSLKESLPPIPAFDKVKTKKEYIDDMKSSNIEFDDASVDEYLDIYEKEYYDSFYSFKFAIEGLKRYINENDLELLNEVKFGDYKFKLVSIRTFLLFR